MPDGYMLQTLGLFLCALSAAIMLALGCGVLWGIERGQTIGVADGPSRRPSRDPVRQPALGRGRGPSIGLDRSEPVVSAGRLRPTLPAYQRGMPYRRKARRAGFLLEVRSKLRPATPFAIGVLAVWMIWGAMGAMSDAVNSGGGAWLVGLSQRMFSH